MTYLFTVPKMLTSQAGLVPVVKFLRNCGMIELIKDTIENKRGANALYDSVDSIFLTTTMSSPVPS